MYMRIPHGVYDCSVNLNEMRVYMPISVSVVFSVQPPSVSVSVNIMCMSLLQYVVPLWVCACVYVPRCHFSLHLPTCASASLSLIWYGPSPSSQFVRVRYGLLFAYLDMAVQSLRICIWYMYTPVSQWYVVMSTMSVCVSLCACLNVIGSPV